MKKIVVAIFALLLVSCGTRHADNRSVVDKVSCFDLMPEGSVEDMLDLLIDGRLCGFTCGEMVEKHTGYADFFTLSDADSADGNMQVVVTFNTRTREVYDMSYYWHLAESDTLSLNAFECLESQLMTRYGVPSDHRIADDDGYGVHYVTSTWKPTLEQGYGVCLELSYDHFGNPPLLMLEVTNPANE